MKDNKFIKKEEEVMNERLSWDVCYYDDMINHDAFILSEPTVISFDGKKEQTMFGANSPLFGTTYGDEQEFLERHRCKCGRFKGMQFKGETCPFCDTKVEARELDIKKTAWMVLGKGNRIINPYWYNVFLKRLIGKKQFPEIVDRVMRIDSDGNQHELVPGVDFEPSTPFHGIGIDGFYDRYEEILAYYAAKKNKPKEFAKALKEKNKVFTSHIPVYSKFLRPSSVSSDTFYFNGIDRQINPCYNLTEVLSECEDIEKPFIQTRIQQRVNAMWQFNFEMINSKKGFIRNKLISGSLNYTSRKRTAA